MPNDNYYDMNFKNFILKLLNNERSYKIFINHKKIKASKKIKKT